MQEASIRLKPGKEKAILQRHHWIFSGAIAESSYTSLAEPASVFSGAGELLGKAFLNPGHSIAAHMIAYQKESIEEAINSRLQEAYHLRMRAMSLANTNAFRLINAEGDGLPGLVIDVYGKVIVIQIASQGMEKLKPLITDKLISLLSPDAIYEKSTSFLRKKQGLAEIKQLLYGKDIPTFQIQENGLTFSIDVLEAQKTGFFLDQREMRSLTHKLAKDKRVLNCFAYTGGFSLFALTGGAKSVHSVEISEKALKALEKNLSLNNLAQAPHTSLCVDAFDFLKDDPLAYDFIILDPPAFVKKREDLSKAVRGYREINFQAMKKMPAGSFLLTSSCSYHLTEEDFQKLLFQAALKANRNVKILSRHLPAFDHPVSLYHPESTYLKSFLLYILD